jgi:hypothetical protein
VTGTAALAGTINFTVAAAFQSSLTLGETFTVLTSSAVSGTFSNSTIAINGTFQFDVSYTAKGVVLTVASTTPTGSRQPGSQTTTAMPVATAKSALATTTTTAKNRIAVASSGLRHAIASSKISRPVVVAAWAPGRSNAIVANGFEHNNLRSWEHIPAISNFKTGAVARIPNVTNAIAVHNLPASDLRTGGASRAIAVPANGSWMGTMGNRRAPVKMMPPMLPRMSR